MAFMFYDGTILLNLIQRNKLTGVNLPEGNGNSILAILKGDKNPHDISPWMKSHPYGFVSKTWFWKFDM